MGCPLLACRRGAGLLGLVVSGALGRRVLLVLIVYFFRDPPRRVPTEPGLVVSPADGRVAEITQLDHDEFIGGPAVRIGIFLSIFNVHINRAPVRAAVIRLHYSPGVVPQRDESAKVRCGTKTCGSAWKKSIYPIGGWSCGRLPACLPGGSSATCGRAKSWSGARNLA